MEARALASESENAELKRKVSVLESQNRTLITQLKRMQSLVMGKASGQKSATALMVLLLSTALFAIPGFKDQYGKNKIISLEVFLMTFGFSPHRWLVAIANYRCEIERKTGIHAKAVTVAVAIPGRHKERRYDEHCEKDRRL